MCRVYSLDTYKSIRNSFSKDKAIKQCEIKSQEDLEMHEKNLRYIKRLEEIEKIDDNINNREGNF